MRLKKFSLTIGVQIFKSVSEEARVRILHLIHTKGELCISDIEHILNFTQTKTARHLSYLKNSGLLATRKHDQWVFYYLKDEVKEMVNQIFKFLDKDVTLVQDIEVYNTLFSNRELAKNKLEQKKWQ
jgi:ArsR family transcriptional regulator